MHEHSGKEQSGKKKRVFSYFLHFIEGKGEGVQWEIQVSKQGKGKIRAEGKKKSYVAKRQANSSLPMEQAYSQAPVP